MQQRSDSSQRRRQWRRAGLAGRQGVPDRDSSINNGRRFQNILPRLLHELRSQFISTAGCTQTSAKRRAVSSSHPPPSCTLAYARYMGSPYNGRQARNETGYTSSQAVRLGRNGGPEVAASRDSCDTSCIIQARDAARVHTRKARDEIAAGRDTRPCVHERPGARPEIWCCLQAVRARDVGDSRLSACGHKRDCLACHRFALVA